MASARPAPSPDDHPAAESYWVLSDRHKSDLGPGNRRPAASKKNADIPRQQAREASPPSTTYTLTASGAQKAGMDPLMKREATVEDYRTLRPMIRLPDVVINQGAAERALFTFTLLTYNVLAQDHIHRSWYPYCAKETLRWPHRRARLTDELTAYDADIVCFQEMDRFHDHFQPLLFQLGYDVRYYLRNGPRSDVNAVGWKRDKFREVASRQISFALTTMMQGSVPNVAQLVALQARADPTVRLIVATTHLYWRADCDHIRLIQMHALFKELHAFRESLQTDDEDGRVVEYLPIVAGDFNSDHESMAIQAVLHSAGATGLLEPETFRELAQRVSMSETMLRELLADFAMTWPRLADAYAHYAMAVPGPNGYDLPYTSFCLYKGVLDFILYGQCQGRRMREERRLCPTALRMMPDRSILESEVALPNHIYASDHLALMAEFTLFTTHSSLSSS